MIKERTKVGDMRINAFTKKGEIRVGLSSCTNMTSSRWDDYALHLLHTRMGMDSGSHRVHTLQHFIDVLDEDKSVEKEGHIFDSDIRAINLRFMINLLKLLMGAKSAYAGKETTKIYINCVCEAVSLLEEAIKELGQIKEDDYK
jgi:hypothetical protein